MGRGPLSSPVMAHEPLMVYACVAALPVLPYGEKSLPQAAPKGQSNCGAALCTVCWYDDTLAWHHARGHGVQGPCFVTLLVEELPG